MTDALQPVAICVDYDGLHNALRARFAELGLTRQQIGMIGKFAEGHAGKLLAPYPIKALGRQTLGKMLKVAALKIALIDDPEARAQITDSGTGRLRAAALPAPGKHKIGNMPEGRALLRQTLHRLLKKHARRAARLGGLARAKKLKPSSRRRIARHAARVRWKRDRERREALRRGWIRGAQILSSQQAPNSAALPQSPGKPRSEDKR